MRIKLTITAIVCAAALQMSIKAQLYPLQTLYNQARNGDNIIKQQIEYKDAGRMGKNVVWDFSSLQSVNPEYLLKYEEFETVPEDTVLAGTEHYTMYYYKTSDTSTEIVGHENPVHKVRYTKPLLKDIYPLNYGDRYIRDYELEGIYSQRSNYYAKGDISIEADAYGIIILPGGDTLRHVLRVKSLQSIIYSDSVNIKTDTSFSESYRWFSAGLRYPVFEIIRTYSIAPKGEEFNLYETAFFYPPPQNKDDSANQNLLTEIEKTDSITQQSSNPWEGMTYNVYPNPVHNDLNFELYLPKPVNNLHIQVHTPMGIVVIDQNKGGFSQGLHKVTFNVRSLRPNTYYVVDFWLDDYFVQGAMVLKK